MSVIQIRRFIYLKVYSRIANLNHSSTQFDHKITFSNTQTHKPFCIQFTWEWRIYTICNMYSNQKYENNSCKNVECDKIFFSFYIRLHDLWDAASFLKLQRAWMPWNNNKYIHFRNRQWHCAVYLLNATWCSYDFADYMVCDCMLYGEYIES